MAGLPLEAGMQVLDVGCGDGFYTKLFARRLVAPGGVVALDSNEACLRVARDHPSRSDAIRRPPVSKPPLVHAESASQ